jgi:hypothetical protein
VSLLRIFSMTILSLNRAESSQARRKASRSHISRLLSAKHTGPCHLLYAKAVTESFNRNALAQMEIGEEAEDEETQERAQVGQDQSDSAAEITVDKA